jgi:pyruvate dehydrogenase E2 component (dihydrolipoyllysine-residue acetyltransferase)
MAVAVRLSDIGEGITEAEIVEWLVADGDTVSEHQPLLRVETDKALVEIPAPAAGRIGRIRHRAGDTVHVGELLVTILVAGESERVTSGTTRASTSVVGALEEQPVDLPQPQPARSATAEHAVLATPAVRRLARELGVDIDALPGTGVGGRVTEADVREHAATHAAPGAPLQAADAYGAVERVALRGVRRTVARRLKTAMAHAALATHMDDADVSALLAHVQAAADSAGPFAWILKATALALKQHPRFNATLDDAHEEVLVKHYLHLGVAVDTADGLMVPVIRDVDGKTIAELADEVERLAAACRARTVDIEALRGGTFSISNIGSLGGLYATPIPNYPEVAILAIGRITERLGRSDNGGIFSRQVLPVSLSFDHRVVDGADAARFVNTLKQILAAPAQLG